MHRTRRRWLAGALAVIIADLVVQAISRPDRAGRGYALARIPATRRPVRFGELADLP